MRHANGIRFVIGRLLVMKKTTNTARLVIFVTALGSVALLASMQGCSSDDETPANPDTDSGPSSSGNPDTGTSSGDPIKDSGTVTDAKTDAKTDSGDGAVACYDNTRSVDGGADAGTFPCPGAGACDDICTAIYRAFKADVADEIVKGLVPASDCVALDADKQRKALITKVKTASGKSCVDATVTQWCSSVPTAAGCKGDATFDANCAAIVKGLTGNGTYGAQSPETGRSIAFKCNTDAVSPGFNSCNECLLAVASGQLFTDN